MARNRPTSVLVVAVLHLVGGTLGLFSTPDAGTTIKASIPLKGDATGETGSPNEGR